MQKFKFITKVLEGSTSPAAIDRDSNIIYLNANELHKYTDAEMEGIIIHEFAHDILNVGVEGEMECDNFAVAALKSSKKDVNPFLSALAKNLPADHPRIKNVKNQITTKLAAFNGQSLSESMTRGDAYSNLEYFDPISMTIGGLGQIANVFTSGRTAKAQERLSKDQLNATRETNAANLEIARLQAEAMLAGNVTGSSNIKTAMIGLIVLAVVVSIAFVIIKRRRSK